MRCCSEPEARRCSVFCSFGTAGIRCVRMPLNKTPRLFSLYADKTTPRVLMQRLVGVYSLVMLMLFLCLPLSGQSNYAVLGGTVVDPQQHVIVGANIRITAVNTEAERHVTSNDRGIFQITGLLPGEYKLSIETAGFAPMSRSVILEVGQLLNLDVTLKLASVIGVVDVS